MTSNQPPISEIRDWTVFGPGYHRNESFYSPADCDRVPKNFNLLRKWISPIVKLGHAKDQGLVKKRLEQSKGFLSLGDVVHVASKGEGRFAIWITNLPTEIGGLVNAGRIKSGSVELIPYFDAPWDQSKRIEGPIITGISLLGEEHPAVKGFAPPHAVFADGRSVPPNHDLTPWFEAMAAETKDLAAGFSETYSPRRDRVFTVNGRDYPITTICFSEMVPMIDKAFLESLGLQPYQIEAIMAKESGGAPPDPGSGAATPPPIDAGAMPPGGIPPAAGALPPSDMPPPPPPGSEKKDKLSQDDQTMMSEDKKKIADLEKRFGAMEKMYSEERKKKEADCMAAFSERVDNVLKVNFKRIPPSVRKAYRDWGIQSLQTAAFADVKGDQEKAFAAWKSTIEAFPESSKFSSEIQDFGRKPGEAKQLTPFQEMCANSQYLKRNRPTAVTKILTDSQPKTK